MDDAAVHAAFCMCPYQQKRVPLLDRACQQDPSALQLEIIRVVRFVDTTRQGLTLVHFSAQLVPFLTQNTP
jgi:hypothetical protein